ncbi:helix-turn-helix domain-containing protein [Mesorhizobium sp.]|uniref:helix-turn-helix domain-containing protein n=1 Tax=Mesorhizobium sp. TaxID=1871066 RepID=UPI00122729D1|nr:helix-turn-helix domain-containing protein [Mesorhizobium sp.]TIL63836.1 MAG: helix-turn-helix domain-containing protein [Mesorhizobium sp.]
MGKRRPSVRGVKMHRNYTVDETARATGACKGTVRRWLKHGLPAITDQKPALILGGDLIDFLKRRNPPRQVCRPHECYCFSCRQPKAPAFGAVEFLPLTASSGNLRALCESCSTVMHKRVASAKLDHLGTLVDVTIMQGSEHLADTLQPCLNDHLAKEPKPHA